MGKKDTSVLDVTQCQPLRKGARLIGKAKWQREKFDFIVIGGTHIGTDIHMEPMTLYYAIPYKRGKSLLTQEMLLFKGKRNIAKNWPYSQSLETILRDHREYIERPKMVD